MSFSYTSSLDSLVFEPLEPHPPSQLNDDAAVADLDLWTNAKFTYDVAPGQGIMEDKKTTSFDLDSAMYEHLSQYLDIDMAAAPSPAAAATATAATVQPSPTITNSSLRPLPPTILPKPTLDLNSNLFLLPSTTTTDLVQPLNATTKKRSSSSSSSIDDRSSGDDDKRRRNTAASARFRIKKKQKEQAMAQTVRDMTEKTETLQNRVHELENEIKWLRELLLEKNSTKKVD